MSLLGCMMIAGTWEVCPYVPGGYRYGPYTRQENAEFMCKLLNEFWEAPAQADKVQSERQIVFHGVTEIERERGIKV